MRDWQAFVKTHLPLAGVKPAREARLVNEVTAQLEDVYREAVLRGATDEEADRVARDHVADWREFAADLAGVDRAEKVPALEQRLEAAIDRPSRVRRLWVVLASARQDLRHAARALTRRPATAVVLVLTLALGIGASTAIFSALHTALFHPLPYFEPDRLVMGRATIEGHINPWVSAPDFFDYRDRNSVLQSLSAYMPAEARATVLTGYSAQSVPVMEVSWDLFRTLGVTPARGRGFSPAEGERGLPDTAMISYGYWQRALGGADDVIGRALHLNYGPRTQALTIVGVMPDGFRIGDAADVWLPMQTNSAPNQMRMPKEWFLVGRLKPGVMLAQAQEQMSAIGRRLEKAYPDSNRDVGLLLAALQEALAEGDRPSVLILMAAVAVLLLVACADAAGLLLSRGVARQTEMAIRSALGATRGNLVRQLLAESLLAAPAAGGLGLFLALWLRHLVLLIVPLDSLGVATLPLGGAALAFAVALTIVTSAIVGLVPAWLGAWANLSVDLKSGTRTSETRNRALVRQGLVALQVAMSVMLLVAAVLLGRSLMQLKSVDPGFRSANLLTARVELTGDAYTEPTASVRFFTEFVADACALPGVASASAINYLPLVDPFSNVPVWDVNHPPVEGRGMTVGFRRRVLPGYFKTMGIPLVAGRDLMENDFAPDRPPVVVISQVLGRRLFPGVDAMGKRLAIATGRPTPMVAEVVGVVGDAMMVSLADVDTPALYVPYQAASRAGMRLVVRTGGDPLAAASAIRAALARRDRGLVLAEVQTMETILADSLQGFSLRTGAIALFGGAALLLAMLGVYGVLAFMVNVRRGDIGLRMVVGASRTQVLRWAMARGMAPVAVGLVVGLAGAVGAGWWLRGELFNVPATDVVTFAGVTVCLTATAAAACLIPAWRAMHVDPVVALRAE
jgi:putative ABC transport system permease protein